MIRTYNGFSISMLNCWRVDSNRNLWSRRGAMVDLTLMPYTSLRATKHGSRWSWYHDDIMMFMPCLHLRLSRIQTWRVWSCRRTKERLWRKKQLEVERVHHSTSLQWIGGKPMGCGYHGAVRGCSIWAGLLTSMFRGGSLHSEAADGSARGGVEDSDPVQVGGTTLGCRRRWKTEFGTKHHFGIRVFLIFVILCI